ncbi:hypothetical protein KKD19_00445 [Patescibacteria group bacterium]|nr:hypothetical protein [Patescibacteria group bacterium]MCG2688765.1 hypothetical protein [Candidatus Parcubacteria bacterium]
MDIQSVIFLGILIAFSVAIFKINNTRNAWDVLFFNSTLAILALFMIGVLANDTNVWKYIVIGLIIIATGEKVTGFFVEKEK